MNKLPATAGVPDILMRDALSLAQAIKSKQVSCAEVMTATLAHIDRVNPRVNAIVSLRDRDDLLEEANIRDRQLARGEYLGWMHGFPQAIKDLAVSNVFPGDLLPKNFGVTRHGRVVFYDYDELCPLVDVRFRDLPEAADEPETPAEPPFYVGENDVFPAEFERFLGLRGRLRLVFLEAHGDLLSPRFWIDLQERIRAGELPDFFPYPAARRLPLRRG